MWKGNKLGQRANYILIEGEEKSIFYHHWRANSIFQDLYIGENRFIDFVKKCKQVEVLLDDVWMEGCVVVNYNKKELRFWSFEAPQTSVAEFFIDKLNTLWKGWSVDLLYNKIYDLEKIFGDNYFDKEESSTAIAHTEQDLFESELQQDDDLFGIAIIIMENLVHITRVGFEHAEAIVNFGEEAIAALLKRGVCKLPLEKDENVCSCLIIDVCNKKILIGESYWMLPEHALSKWPGFELEMGDFGYVGTLKRAGMDISKVIMSKDEIEEQFTEIVNSDNSFDPFSMAKFIMKESNDVKFNPFFFDNARPEPRPTFAQKIKALFRSKKRN